MVWIVALAVLLACIGGACLILSLIALSDAEDTISAFFAAVGASVLLCLGVGVAFGYYYLAGAEAAPLLSGVQQLLVEAVVP